MATLEQPPTSVHFLEASRIQPPTSAHAPAPALAPSVAVLAPATNIASYLPTQATNSQDGLIQLALTNPHLTQLLIQQQQQQQQSIFQQLPFFQQMPQPLPFASPAAPLVQPAPPSNPVPNHVSAPPSPSKAFRLPHPVSCREFCDRYNISAADEEKLNTLEFIPGEREIEALGREDWQEVAKFSKLGWGRFLAKHKQFMADVASGGWELSGAESVGN
jgi:hypothetical protein